MDRKLSRPDVDEDPGIDRIVPPHVEGGTDNRGRRAAPGSGVVEGSGAGAGGGGNPEDFDDDPAGGAGRYVNPGKKPEAGSKE